jgi:hypothetical protein
LSQEALDYLSYPSLIPTFAPEILLTLINNVGHDLTLPLAYYHNANPPLTEPKLLNAFFTALARSSTTQAYTFIHTQPEIVQKRLFEQLISTTLSQPASDSRAERAMELIALPFTQEEDKWFESYLIKGEGQKIHGARETLIMRQLGSSNFANAIENTRSLKGRRQDGLNWAELRQGFENGLGGREQRSPFVTIASEN